MVFSKKQSLRHPNVEKKPRRSYLQGTQAKRPKPVFTDSRKLDNSRDWEKVKVAKPPPEDLSDPSSFVSSSTRSSGITTTNITANNITPIGNINSKSMKKLEIIRKELDGLQRDIEQSERLQGK